MILIYLDNKNVTFYNEKHSFVLKTCILKLFGETTIKRGNILRSGFNNFDSSVWSDLLGNWHESFILVWSGFRV